MYRYRQRRLSASDRSRVLLEVRKTIGICRPVTVPIPGMDTWKSDRISSSSASASTSSRSTSSMSRITGSVDLIASSSGRVSRNSSLKMFDSCPASPPQPLIRSAMMRSSCLE